MIGLSAWSLCPITLTKRNLSFSQTTWKLELTYTSSFSTEEHVTNDFRITCCFPLHVQQHTCTLRSSIFFHSGLIHYPCIFISSLSFYLKLACAFCFNFFLEHCFWSKHPSEQVNLWLPRVKRLCRSFSQFLGLNRMTHNNNFGTIIFSPKRLR